MRKCSGVVPIVALLVPVSARAQSQLGPPVVSPGWRLGLQFTPAFPGGDLDEGTDTGIGGRLRVASEYMFGRLGVSPGVSAQFLRFGLDFPPGFEEPDGSVVYVGGMPSVQIAGHLGMAAPFFGFGVGFDHYRMTDELADEVEAAGLDTSASGVGFDFMMGVDVWLSPAFAGHFGIQIHPIGPELNDGDPAFNAFDFGMTAAF